MSELSIRLGGIRDRLVGTGQREQSAVPGRIMAPRIIFVACSGALVLFGMLMIYSASSIVGLTSKMYGFDPAYFLIRQVGFGGVGLLAAIVLAKLDYHFWHGAALKVVWVITLLSLLVVYTPIAGRDAYGATRWIALGPFSLQPSEFAKVVIVLVGARIADEFFGARSLTTGEAVKLFLVGVAVPLLLILLQPDKGTTGVLLATLAVMAYLAGIPGRTIMIALVCGLAAAMVWALKDEYSRARIMTMFDPFNDEYGAGYQLVQGFYALGSGGIGGVGLGMSRQKYNYLPMAHNDFIFAVVGEELGFIGVVVLLVVFCALLWAGLKIAENAPDLTGRLIAAGCTSLIVIQLLLNVCGVIGIFPLSGKPVPFVSYGGSSIISSLMLVGLVISVSLRSTLPQTSYERRRSQLRIADSNDAVGEDDDFAGMVRGSTAGRVTPRSSSLVRGRGSANVTSVSSSRESLRIVEGGRSRSAQPSGRVTVDASGRKRIDLGPSAAERLRGRGSKR